MSIANLNLVTHWKTEIYLNKGGIFITWQIWGELPVSPLGCFSDPAVTFSEVCLFVFPVLGIEDRGFVERSGLQATSTFQDLLFFGLIWCIWLGICHTIALGYPKLSTHSCVVPCRVRNLRVSDLLIWAVCCHRFPEAGHRCPFKYKKQLHQISSCGKHHTYFSQLCNILDMSTKLVACHSHSG